MVHSTIPGYDVIHQVNTSCGTWSLNVTKMNYFIRFSTLARYEITVFTCGVRFSCRNMLTYPIRALFSGWTHSSTVHICEISMAARLSRTSCTPEAHNEEMQPSCWCIDLFHCTKISRFFMICRGRADGWEI